jgi:hypothetical protein
MRAALILRQRVNLVHDQPARFAEDRQPFLLAEQQAKALRCREQNVRRPDELARANPARRVARAQFDANGWLLPNSSASGPLRFFSRS